MIKYELEGVIVDYQIVPAGIRLGMAEKLSKDVCVWVQLPTDSTDLMSVAQALGQKYHVIGKAELWQLTTLENGKVYTDVLDDVPLLPADVAQPLGVNLTNESRMVTDSDRSEKTVNLNKAAASEDPEEDERNDDYDNDDTVLPSDDEIRRQAKLDEEHDIDALQNHLLDNVQSVTDVVPPDVTESIDSNVSIADLTDISVENKPEDKTVVYDGTGSEVDDEEDEEFYG